MLRSIKNILTNCQTFGCASVTPFGCVSLTPFGLLFSCFFIFSIIFLEPCVILCVFKLPIRCTKLYDSFVYCNNKVLTIGASSLLLLAEANICHSHPIFTVSCFSRSCYLSIITFLMLDMDTFLLVLSYVRYGYNIT